MLGNLRYIQYTTINHKLNTVAIAYIDEARASDPARPVGINARTNIVAADASMKMNMTIAAESHAERSYALQLEYDSAVFEYWDQPPKIEIRRFNKRGARRRTEYTADFLVLRSSGPEVIEVKTLDDAEKLVTSDPNNWVKTETGFDYIPAREAFKLQYGLLLRVVVITRKDHQIAENIRILSASRDAQAYNSDLGKKVDRLFEDKPLWKMDELSYSLEQSDYTAVIQMIDEGRLAFQLASSSLIYPEYCYVSKNKNLLIGLANPEGDELSGELSPIGKSESPTSKIAERVLKRLERIESNEKSSSVRRWKRAIADGREKGLTPFLALIDADRNVSGRSSKLVSEVKNFLDYFVDNYRLLMRTETQLQIYYEYCIQAKKSHPKFPPVSTQTFYLRLKKIDPELLGQAVGGKRMARANAQPTDSRKRHFKPELPWVMAGVDHCKVKLSLIVYENLENIYVQQPWLSTMFDVATGEVLAFSISFEDPSRRSCARLIRDCVRSHGKLPREIIVDHGSDFTSVYFRSLLAHYRVTHTLRPSGNSRAGSEVERFFGQYKKEWLPQRPGYVMPLKTQRAIDGNKSAGNYAILTIEDIHQELKAYLQWRSSKPIGTASKSSIVQYLEKIGRFPFISINVDYDKKFILATCIEISNYSIDFQRGIHIKETYYSCPELQMLRGVKTRADVRKDPENPYLIYVLIQDKWHAAYATKYNRYITKNLAARMAEGINVYECSAMRRKIKLSKGIELRKISNEFDHEYEQRLGGEKQVFEPRRVEENFPPDDLSEVFSIRELKAEGWDE